MPTVDINGTSIFYHEAGFGPPVLALHGGLGFDHSYMARALSGLKDGFRIIAPDHRGNGRSGRPPKETFSMAQFARDLESLRTELGLGKIALVGHSYGGFIALQYALDFPHSVGHLVLVDTAAAIEPDDAVLQRAKARNPSAEVLDALLFQPTTDAEFEATLAVSASIYFHEESPGPHDELAGTVFSQYGNARGEELLAEFDLTPRLPELQVPTLILCGKDDLITPVERATVLHQNVKNSELVVFEKSGHVPFFEEPAAFTQVVKGFLQRPPTDYEPKRSS